MRISRSYTIFVIFILAFCALFVTVESINHKLWTNDFKVYYEAVNDFFAGNNPYVKNYGLETGFFKYPPFTLYLFSIYKLIPYGIAQFVHLSLITISLMISIILTGKIIRKTFGLSLNKKQTWILYVTFLCVVIHLTRELHMGNVNLILLALFVLGLNKLNDPKIIYTAVFWSLMVILKPIMILAFLPLLFFKKWKLIIALGAFGVIYFLFPILHMGWSGNLELWQNWFKSIADHGEYIVSENSLKYISTLYFGTTSVWIPSVVGLLILIAVMVFEMVKNVSDHKSLIFWTIIFTAFTPNFFVTDTEHFLLTIPTLMTLLYFLTAVGKKYYWIGFFIAMIPFSLNSNDLWGRKISDYFDALGFLGIGNMIFIITVILVFFKIRKAQLFPTELP